MDTAVNDINRKEMQECEEHRFAADFSPASGFFFTSPFRSLTTTGCFSRIQKTAAVRCHPVRYPAAFGAVYSAAEPLVRSRRLYGRRSAAGERP